MTTGRINQVTAAQTRGGVHKQLGTLARAAQSFLSFQGSTLGRIRARQAHAATPKESLTFISLTTLFQRRLRAPDRAPNHVRVFRQLDSRAPLSPTTRNRLDRLAWPQGPAECSRSRGLLACPCEGLCQPLRPSVPCSLAGGTSAVTHYMFTAFPFSLFSRNDLSYIYVSVPTKSPYCPFVLNRVQMTNA